MGGALFFGFSQKAFIGDLSENNIHGSHKNRSHPVVRSREDGKEKTTVRQFLGSFTMKEK